MTGPGCGCPPVRLFLIETGSWQVIDAHRGSCATARWPQTGRQIGDASLGPRESCTCIRALNVPEYVHDYQCPLHPSTPEAKAGAAAYVQAIRRCACPRVIVDDGEHYVLQVVHETSCKHFGRRT